MRLIATAITRQSIDDEIRSVRYPGHDPARWALPLLDLMASRDAAWALVELDAAEFGSLWLPVHCGEPCHGDALQLGTDARGGPLEDLAGWLDHHADAYAASNSSCWGRLQHARRDAASTIVISRSDVGDRIKPADAPFVVVDGLHRTLAWWRRGDRSCRAYLVDPAKYAD